MKYFLIFLAVHGCLLPRQGSHDHALKDSLKHNVDVEASVPEGISITFEEDIAPLLKSRCQPCHFEGGKMYSRLPFDTATTILEVGDRLLTRIKDPNESRLIKEFLETNAE